jgi:electron transport complex protein RnfB
MIAIASLFAVPAIGLFIGYLLGYAAIYFKVESDPRVDELTAMLPNGQCGQCGFPGCAQAAAAMVRGEAAASACTPGGQVLANRIAEFLGIDADQDSSAAPQVALIDSVQCDGCARCAKVCTFDAIIGALRQQHGVLAQDCTGCGACLKACPQQVISLRDDPWLTPAIGKPSLNVQEISYV